MRQEQRFLLAITLMILVLVGTNILFPPIPPEEVVSPEGDAPGQLDGTGVTGVPSAPLGGTDAARGAAASGDQGDPLAGPPPTEPPSLFPPAEVVATPAEDTVVVEGPLYRYSWSTLGARLISAQLLAFESFDEGQEGQPVELISAGTGGVLAMQLRLGERTFDLGARSFEVEPVDGLRLNEGGGPRTLTFRYRDPAGLIFQTAYTFDPSSYDILARTEVVGPAVDLLVTGMGSGLGYNERSRSEESTVMGYVWNHVRDGIDDERLTRVEEERIQEGPHRWAALKSKYFIFALIPGREGGEQYLGGVIARPAEGDDQAAITVTQSLDASGVLDYRVYLGPQERDVLVAFENDLEEANPYGYRWMRPIVRPVVSVALSILNFLHRNLNVGYGWALIIFGVMMRVLLWPLNQKAMRAQMRNMAAQPLLKEIQTKYKDQPEKLQKEMMKLYKEHGFNPLGGCLPMLLPFPVLITLFFVFRNTIQLRGESFLWLPNLAGADPLYILPVLLGLSMFLLMSISARSMPPNPQMKMMRWIMPIFMAAIFVRFASGLNLYYAVTNLATLPQSFLIAKERQQVRDKGPIMQPHKSGD
ncbi:MAG: membrane protein insertase YidC [Gemmatimonadota bacterium]|nr:membrane protein insertase YidC [Gemmatimonadota bacterium]